MNIYFVPTGVAAIEDPKTIMAILGMMAPHARDILADYGSGKGEASAVLASALSDLVFRDPVRLARSRTKAAHMFTNSAGDRPRSVAGLVRATHWNCLSYLIRCHLAPGREGSLARTCRKTSRNTYMISKCATRKMVRPRGMNSMLKADKFIASIWPPLRMNRE
jgi:hypothetical protein